MIIINYIYKNEIFTNPRILLLRIHISSNNSEEYIFIMSEEIMRF